MAELLVPHMTYPERMLADEKIVTQLVISYINETLKKPEEVLLDPDPKNGYSNEQYHIWYYPNLDNIRYRQYFEMVGWFFIRGRNIEMTFIGKLPWQEHYMGRPTNTICLVFDVADPKQLQMKKFLRKAFDKAKRFLKRAAKRDK
jgi:hypothetical protein